jgi:hypothetical protein
MLPSYPRRVLGAVEMLLIGVVLLGQSVFLLSVLGIAG